MNRPGCGLSLYHRPCLSFGLSWLVLPIIWSVHQPLAPRTLIPVPNDVRTMKLAFSLDFLSNVVISLIFLVSSMWNLPKYGKILTIGQRHQLAHHRCDLQYILYGRYPLVPNVYGLQRNFHSVRIQTTVVTWPMVGYYCMYPGYHSSHSRPFSYHSSHPQSFGYCSSHPHSSGYRNSQYTVPWLP